MLSPWENSAGKTAVLGDQALGSDGPVRFLAFSV